MWKGLCWPVPSNGRCWIVVAVGWCGLVLTTLFSGLDGSAIILVGLERYILGLYPRDTYAIPSHTSEKEAPQDRVK